MICETQNTIYEKWDGSKDDACVVDYCMKVMDAARKESCGNCVLCREGTRQVYEIIKDITKGNAEREDYDLLLDLLGQISSGASCDMSRAAAATCLDLMKSHEEEWDKHIRLKRCQNLVCKAAYTLYVDPQLCNGCGKCIGSCPQGAISGGVGMIHVIDANRCNKTLACLAACPTGAIKKAGPIKPKLPTEPVPVGSFGQAADEEAGSMRRRRR